MLSDDVSMARHLLSVGWGLDVKWFRVLCFLFLLLLHINLTISQISDDFANNKTNLKSHPTNNQNERQLQRRQQPSVRGGRPGQIDLDGIVT